MTKSLLYYASSPAAWLISAIHCAEPRHAALDYQSADGEILKDSPGWLDEAVDTAEASRIVGFPACTLHTWRSRGDGPPFLKIGLRSVRYQRRALFQWLAERQRRNTADDGGDHG